MIVCKRQGSRMIDKKGNEDLGCLNSQLLIAIWLECTVCCHKQHVESTAWFL